MQTNDLIEFARRWSKMNAAHIEQRVAAWEGGYGLLFVGATEQTSEAIESMREYLKPDAVLRFDGQKKSEWWKETDFLFEKDTQQSLFEKEIQQSLFEKETQQSLVEKSPSRVVVVAESLDGASEWLNASLKSMFERAVVPAILLATATDEGAIPSYLLSHYYRFHATANKRKVSDAYKPLPPKPTTP